MRQFLTLFTAIVAITAFGVFSAIHASKIANERNADRSPASVPTAVVVAR